MVKLEHDGKQFLDGRPPVMVSRTASDGSSTSNGRMAERGGVTFDGQTPGTCTVTIRESDLPGWTCTMQTVELRAGETTTVVLKLEKKP